MVTDIRGSHTKKYVITCVQYVSQTVHIVLIIFIM